MTTEDNISVFKPGIQNQYRNVSGTRLLKPLFYETSWPDRSKVLYTLKDVDWEGHPSLYRLYMEARDILEYTFANTHFDGWEHWQMVCDCTWFKPYISRWRHELELLERSEALARLQSDAKSGSRSSAVSNRWLLEKGWVEKDKKGRPSKADIRRRADELAHENAELDADLARILPTGASNVQ